MSMALATKQTDTNVPQMGAARLSFSSNVQRAVVLIYGPLKNGAKIAARDASHGDHQVSDHTARAWLKGQRKPCQLSCEILAARKLYIAKELENDRRSLREAISGTMDITEDVGRTAGGAGAT